MNNSEILSKPQRERNKVIHIQQRPTRIPCLLLCLGFLLFCPPRMLAPKQALQVAKPSLPRRLCISTLKSGAGQNPRTRLLYTAFWLSYIYVKCNLKLRKSPKRCFGTLFTFYLLLRPNPKPHTWLTDFTWPKKNCQSTYTLQ
jgi:hypothetical protein